MNNLTNYTQLIKQLPENIIGYFRGKTILEAIKEFIVLKGDKVIWACVLLLMTMGSLLFFSTSMKLIGKESLSVFNIFLIFFRKHLFYVITGITIILFIQRINYQIFLKLSKIGVLIMMGLLIFTIGFGVNEGDAMRKIIIPGIGSFQPAEFAKVFAILDIAASLSKLSRTKKEEISYLNYYFSLAFSGLLILLVGVNSNSAALILIFTLIAMIMISPVPKKELRRAAFYLLVIIGPLIFIASSKFRFNVFVERMELFFEKDFNGRDGIGSPDIKDNNQQDLAISAVATPPIPFGKLPGGSEIKASLPLAYSDFVYAVLVEEYGLLGGISVIILYLILIKRSYQSLEKIQSYGGVYLTFGLIFYMSIQAFIHIFVNIGIFPVTGQTLPFISQGGASIWASSIAIGLILSIISTDSKKQA